jgi:Superinfection immunity protein
MHMPLGPALLLALSIATLYFLPSLIGSFRDVPHVGSIIVVNVFLGWTFLGWVIALAMAARSAEPSVHLQAEQTIVQSSVDAGRADDD